MVVSVSVVWHVAPPAEMAPLFARSYAAALYNDVVEREVFKQARDTRSLADGTFDLIDMGAPYYTHQQLGLEVHELPTRREAVTMQVVQVPCNIASRISV